MSGTRPEALSGGDSKAFMNKGVLSIPVERTTIIGCLRGIHKSRRLFKTLVAEITALFRAKVVPPVRSRKLDERIDTERRNQGTCGPGGFELVD